MSIIKIRSGVFHSQQTTSQQTKIICKTATKKTLKITENNCTSNMVHGAEKCDPNNRSHLSMHLIFRHYPHLHLPTPSLHLQMLLYIHRDGTDRSLLHSDHPVITIMVDWVLKFKSIPHREMKRISSKPKSWSVKAVLVHGWSKGDNQTVHLILQALKKEKKKRKKC